MGPSEAQGSARQKRVSVIGSGGCGADSEIWALAEEVGRLLAGAGATVICGGRGGVMEAVARGAAGAGGTVIGILPGTDPAEANPHCTHAIASAVGHARNLAVVASGQATIAVGGEWGTLSEIGHARSMGRPVIVLRSWELTGGGETMHDAPGVSHAKTPAEAVALALAVLASAT